MLRCAMTFLAISIMVGIFQFTQFSGIYIPETGIAVLLSLGFLLPFLLFVIFGLLALGGTESESDDDPLVVGVRHFSGWQ